MRYSQTEHLLTLTEKVKNIITCIFVYALSMYILHACNSGEVLPPLNFNFRHKCTIIAVDTVCGCLIF